MPPGRAVRRARRPADRPAPLVVVVRQVVRRQRRPTDSAGRRPVPAPLRWPPSGLALAPAARTARVLGPVAAVRCAAPLFRPGADRVAAVPGSLLRAPLEQVAAGTPSPGRPRAPPPAPRSGRRARPVPRPAGPGRRRRPPCGSPGPPWAAAWPRCRRGSPAGSPGAGSTRCSGAASGSGSLCPPPITATVTAATTTTIATAKNQNTARLSGAENIRPRSCHVVAAVRVAGTSREEDIRDAAPGTTRIRPARAGDHGDREPDAGLLLRPGRDVPRRAGPRARGAGRRGGRGRHRRRRGEGGARRGGHRRGGGPADGRLRGRGAAPPPRRGDQRRHLAARGGRGRVRGEARTC